MAQSDQLIAGFLLALMLYGVVWALILLISIPVHLLQKKPRKRRYLKSLGVTVRWGILWSLFLTAILYLTFALVYGFRPELYFRPLMVG